ncbi:two-component system sensor histidine kinase NtrB [Martelella mediterranea]|uniref:histidine kinase n=1 Tax=Martelella mediterranea TaxID=293089 RepID=A0A4R3NXV2_9HYPH|nr:nitrogen regulation protein NR(II) [Martelella mediterranea]TCT39294.1 PAS/PAC sensor signal transduction histidine kinase [Martelella mediterranea]
MKTPKGIGQARLPAESVALEVLNAIQNPVVLIDHEGLISYSNWEAEVFFGSSAAHLARKTLEQFIPYDSPLLSLIDQVRKRRAPVNEYRVDLSSPKLGQEKLVDIYVAPVGDEGSVVLVLQVRSMADKIDRQLVHRAAARSVTGLASMLAHEIKNPLSGIRGAAQLLETNASDEDRALTRLICDESDRIVSLVDRMEVFSDERPIDRVPLNIHSVLDHVKAVAKAGFARNIRISEEYDPSLPLIFANRDQLVQVFLNLIKNASEAVSDRPDGEIVLTSAYRPGMRMSVAGSQEKISLPLEFCVHDNGPGVPQDLMSHLFDPFITTKPNGTGLGLALVAKIIGGHGGIVECDSASGRTTFRILMPVSKDVAAMPSAQMDEKSGKEQ